MPISLHHAQVFYPPGEKAKARAFYGTALGLAERARLARCGARFEEATPIPGSRRCYVFDPFGNKIELDEIR